MSSTILYAIACVIVPALWGVAMYHAFGWWEARRARRGGSPARAADDDRRPPINYSI